MYYQKWKKKWNKKTVRSNNKLLTREKFNNKIWMYTKYRNNGAMTNINGALVVTIYKNLKFSIKYGIINS